MLGCLSLGLSLHNYNCIPSQTNLIFLYLSTSFLRYLLGESILGGLEWDDSIEEFDFNYYLLIT